MDSAEDVDELLSRLSSNIKSMEASLEPLISTALSEKARQLSPLERAKLCSYVVYAIDSLIFSYLRLSGVDAKEHPVFRELARTKQYFEKIKEAEEGPKRKLQLDKSAANRFIKHALGVQDKPGAKGDAKETASGGESAASPQSSPSKPPGEDGKSKKKAKRKNEAVEAEDNEAVTGGETTSPSSPAKVSEEDAGRKKKKSKTKKGKK